MTTIRGEQGYKFGWFVAWINFAVAADPSTISAMRSAVGGWGTVVGIAVAGSHVATGVAAAAVRPWSWYLLLASVLFRLVWGNVSTFESVQAYRKAIDLDASHVDARMGLAEVYEDKGLYREAIGEYRKVVDADGKNTGALYNLALVYEKVGAKESIALWERYIAVAGALPSEKDWVDVVKLHLTKLRGKQENGN